MNSHQLGSVLKVLSLGLVLGFSGVSYAGDTILKRINLTIYNYSDVSGQFSFGADSSLCQPSKSCPFGPPAWGTSSWYSPTYTVANGTHLAQKLDIYGWANQITMKVYVPGNSQPILCNTKLSVNSSTSGFSGTLNKIAASPGYSLQCNTN